jgi:hypothetical protein
LGWAIDHHSFQEQQLVNSIMWKSFWQNPLRWLKRRYVRWFALVYWAYCWLKISGDGSPGDKLRQRQIIQVQIWRVLSGFNHASWVLAMEDFIKPEYWMM